MFSPTRRELAQITKIGVGGAIAAVVYGIFNTYASRRVPIKLAPDVTNVYIDSRLVVLLHAIEKEYARADRVAYFRLVYKADSLLAARQSLGEVHAQVTSGQSRAASRVAAQESRKLSSSTPATAVQAHGDYLEAKAMLQRLVSTVENDTSFSGREVVACQNLVLDVLEQLESHLKTLMRIRTRIKT